MLIVTLSLLVAVSGVYLIHQFRRGSLNEAPPPEIAAIEAEPQALKAA